MTDRAVMALQPTPVTETAMKLVPCLTSLGPTR